MKYKRFLFFYVSLLFLSVYLGTCYQNREWRNCLQLHGQNYCKCIKLVDKFEMLLKDPCPGYIRSYDECIERYNNPRWCSGFKDMYPENKNKTDNDR